jgi:hypothetical protein
LRLQLHEKPVETSAQNTLQTLVFGESSLRNWKV